VWAIVVPDCLFGEQGRDEESWVVSGRLWWVVRGSHIVKGKTTVTPGPVVVPEADATVSLPSQAHHHSPGDGDH
jgi:hypothetical protein